MERSLPPRKRRKTRSNSSTENGTKSLTKNTACISSAQKRRATRSMTRVGWKSGALPVELFEHIISYLSRKDIQNMRFVNHEFEEKVSKHLFKTVVVPFKPEIYEIADEVSYSFTTSKKKKKNGKEASMPSNKNGAVILQDKGMRVFQGFGRHISRFAMSFEFDPVTLTAPPMKCDQEAITSFWGIFRWPHKAYNRYAQLEGLEQTADETRTLAQALTYITNAKELALSIDSGLGWLSGPDVNYKMDPTDHNRVVFGESRFAPEPKKRSKQRSSSRSLKHHNNDTVVIPELEIQQQKVYERMLEGAGYTSSNMKQAIILLAEHDGTLRPELALPGTTTETASPNDTTKELLTLENQRLSEPCVDAESDLMLLPISLESMRTKTEAVVDPLLKPADLTTAQKEMLLETEWAHRAFMQSYTIAVIDNPQTFLNVRTLTFARIPSRHVRIISRNDFWNSLPHLMDVSLAVIPDWRDVTKLATTYVQDIPLKPSSAIPEVHLLIEDFIAPKKSIKRFHFEWLCGGEEAPGMFARGQLILPAPVLEGTMEMVNLGHQPSLLVMPHIEHLSFKNCWFSPHIMIQLVTTHRNKALASLILDSVSLSAPSTRLQHRTIPSMLHHPPIVAQNPAQVMLQGPQNPAANLQPFLAGANIPAPAVGNGNANQNLIAQGAGVVIPLGLAPPVTAVAPVSNETDGFWLDYLESPRKHSWADVLDNITPGETITEARYAYDDRNPEPPIRHASRLQKIIFRSCGYVRLPIDLDHSVFDFAHLRAQSEHPVLTKKKAEIDSFMMKKTDYALGTIIPWMDHTEMVTIEQAFFLGLGWDPSEPNHGKLRAQYKADYHELVVPGAGRFYGTLQRKTRDNTNSNELA